MDDIEEAFRAGLGRVDTLTPPVPPIDPGALMLRAGRRRLRGWPVGAAVAAGAAIAVVAVVIGPGLVRGPVQAVPVQAPTVTSSPAALAWVRIAASPLSPRWDAVGVWVQGRYLVVGGRVDPPCPPTASCAWPMKPMRDGALYDPESDSWTPITPLPQSIRLDRHPVVLGASVYVLQGPTGRDGPRLLLRYDVEADSWTTYELPKPLSGGLIATDRAIVVLSGSDESGVAHDYVFTPETGAWTTLPDDPLGPSFDRGATWLGDRLLLTAHDLVASPGSEKPSLMRLAELDATLTKWRTLPDSQLIGSGGGLGAGGRVVWPSTGSADGGKVNNWGRFYPFGGILDPASGAWTDLPPARESGGLKGQWVATDHLVAVGGDLLDPVTLRWTRVPPPPDGERTGRTVVGAPGAVLVWGGSDGTTSYADGFLLRVG